eukprot:scaffold729_cov57-Phaeocystis_antarctica.AAC.1
MRSGRAYRGGALGPSGSLGPGGGLSLGQAISRALPAWGVDAILRRLLHPGSVEPEALPEAQHRARDRPEQWVVGSG